MSFVIHIPLAKPLPSAANLREFWATKAKRMKAQRDMVRLAFQRKISTGNSALDELSWRCDAHWIAVWDGPLCLRVCLVRIAPRKLDSDNLSSAFKAHRDEIAKMGGIDDGNSIWRWEYAQEKGPPGIRIEVGE